MASRWTFTESKDIPEDGLRHRDSVEITEKWMSIQKAGSSGELKIYYKEAKPLSQPGSKNNSILLLHGMNFSSQTWLDLGTLSIMASLGYHTVAVDLPGFAKTGGHRLDDSETPDFMKKLISGLGIDNIVIVSPSMSGTYALPYILDGHLKDSKSVISGYVPVAPVNAGHYTKKHYTNFLAPVLIVYGDNDRMLQGGLLEHLSQFPNKFIVGFKDAGHACYMNNPELWHKSFYNFLCSI